MNRHLIVDLLFFVSAALLLIGGYNYYAKEKKSKDRVKQRIETIGTIFDQAVVEPEKYRRDRLLPLSGTLGNGFDWLEELLIQTGLRLERSTFFAIIFILSAIATLIPILFGTFLSAPLGIIGILAISFFVLRYLRSRRIAKFEEQLPEAIDIIVRGLRAGYPLTTALSLVRKDLQEPAALEFGTACDEVSFGLDLRSAMKNLTKRVGAPDLLFLVTSVSIQSQSGGNLAEILSRLSSVMRERAKLRQKIKSVSAEGRMTGAVLTALLILALVSINFVNPGYYGDVWSRPEFRLVLYLAGVMLFVGHLVIKRMVNFKF